MQHDTTDSTTVTSQPQPHSKPFQTPSYTSPTLLPPPQRLARIPSPSNHDDHDDHPSSPGSYIRDPHKLIAYLVPFPAPTKLPSSAPAPPIRFLIYTPPPPPLEKPAEGEKEGKAHKLQRKWQAEVRQAKTSDAKVTSWKGVKGRATKGINWAVNQVSSADLDFLTRVPGDDHSHSSSRSRSPSPGADLHADDGVRDDSTTTKKTVGLEEMVIIYPPSIGIDEETLRAEFVNTILRTKDKAQRDAIIATGLLPVAGAIDVALTLVWPFGGLLEVDGVWAFSSIKGAKSARSITKRLVSSSPSTSSTTTTTKSDSLNKPPESTEPSLRLVFKSSPQTEIMHDYLVARCIERDVSMFKRQATGTMAGESEVLEAIGWTPSATTEEKNWEDESWEREQVKEDLRQVFRKAAKAWDKWCKAFAKNPEKALKK